MGRELNRVRGWYYETNYESKERGLTLMILKWIWGVVAGAVSYDKSDITIKKVAVTMIKPTATHNATFS